jgi:hypothetical protein
VGEYLSSEYKTINSIPATEEKKTKQNILQKNSCKA